jgi:hypothetical protein
MVNDEVVRWPALPAAEISAHAAIARRQWQTASAPKLARAAHRLGEALAQQRQSEVDREVARVLARSGGRITDSMEREIMQKVFASDWSLPQ